MNSRKSELSRNRLKNRNKLTSKVGIYISRIKSFMKGVVKLVGRK